MRIPPIAAWPGGVALAMALVGGCATVSETSTDASPRCSDEDEVPEASVSFDRRPIDLPPSEDPDQVNQV